MSPSMMYYFADVLENTGIHQHTLLTRLAEVEDIQNMFPGKVISHDMLAVIALKLSLPDQSCLLMQIHNNIGEMIFSDEVVDQDVQVGAQDALGWFNGAYRLHCTYLALRNSHSMRACFTLYVGGSAASILAMPSFIPITSLYNHAIMIHIKFVANL